MNRRQILALFIERWLEQVSRLDYSSLCVAQPRPTASIACGAAGIAVALARASHRLGRPELRAAATQWAAAAARARREEFVAAEIRQVAGSLWFGPDGATAVSAVLADDFAFAPAAASRKHDVLGGRAGWMPLLLRLETHGGEPRHADAIAHSLLRSRAYATGDVGFAHGRLGIQHALLGWAARRRRALPPSFWKALRGSAALDGGMAGGGALSRSWCNGTAGLLLTLTLAYEVSGDRGYLAAARKAARHVAGRARGAGRDLCCGDVGRAYALATFARSDPSGNWLEHAWDLALRAIISPGNRWPNGLLKGWPGLVCLALDLVDGRVELPFVDVRVKTSMS